MTGPSTSAQENQWPLAKPWSSTRSAPRAARARSTGRCTRVKPVDLVVGLMHEMLARNAELDPNAHRRRRARLRLARRRPGRGHRQDRGDQGRPAGHGRRRAAQPLLRLGPRGGQHRRAEGRLRLGGPGARRRRRVDVARADGLRRRRLGDGPGDQLRHVLHPAGHRRRPDRHGRGFSREDVDAYAARSQERAAAPRRRRAASPTRVVPVLDLNDQRRPRPRRVHPPGHDGGDARQAQAVVRDDGRDGRLRRRRAAEVPLDRADRPRPHAGQLVGHRRRRLAADHRQRADRQRRSASTPRGAHPRHRASPAPTRRSCSPAPPPRPARRWPRPA